MVRQHVGTSYTHRTDMVHMYTVHAWYTRVYYHVLPCQWLSGHRECPKCDPAYAGALQGTVLCEEDVFTSGISQQMYDVCTRRFHVHQAAPTASIRESWPR
jgi:hypothetical protein